MVRSLTEPKIGPADHESPGIDELQLQARVREIANRWPAVGLAVGVVRDGSLEFFSGHGLANIASNTPITEDTVFRVGSLTKTFTAIAVLQLWEQGRIDLDAPANHYLRTFRLVPAKASFRPATVRQLLTHTAGIGEVLHPAGLLRPLFGETVKAGGPVPSLAEYYRGVWISRPSRAPGSGTPTTVSPPSASSSRTSPGSAWTATSTSTSSSPSAWPTPAWSDPNWRRRAWRRDTSWALGAHERSPTMR